MHKNDQDSDTAEKRRKQAAAPEHKSNLGRANE